MDKTASRAVHWLWLDSFGATISLACAVQCAALPIAITLLPFHLLTNVLPFIPVALLPGGGFDRIALAGASALAAGSFSCGFRSHGRAYIFVFLIVAVGVIGVGWLWVKNRYQILFVVAGALILAAGHVLNRHLCRTPEPKVAPERAAFKNSSGKGD